MRAFRRHAGRRIADFKRTTLKLLGWDKQRIRGTAGNIINFRAEKARIDHEILRLGKGKKAWECRYVLTFVTLFQKAQVLELMGFPVE